MAIRAATRKDAKALCGLLDETIRPPARVAHFAMLDQLFGHPDHRLLVDEERGSIRALISLHYVPSLGCGSELCLVMALAVDKRYRNKGIGSALEEYATELARARGCGEIQLNCPVVTTPGKFPLRQGYAERCGCYSKPLA